MKEILDRILPESNDGRFWLLFWAMVFMFVSVVAVCVSASCSLTAYYVNKRPAAAAEEVQQELQNWNVHFERRPTK